MTCTQCGTEHPWYATACGAPVEFSDADRQLQALLQGPERDAIFSWMLDQALEVWSTPRSPGRENVSRWIEERHIGPMGPAEATKSLTQWCRENGKEFPDPRDIVEVFEEMTGHPFAGAIQEVLAELPNRAP